MNARTAAAYIKSKLSNKSRSPGMAEPEIFLGDLTPEAQTRVLRIIGIKIASEANLDIFPLFILQKG